MTHEDADTLADRAAQRIEADILAGALAPDSRLGIAETAARYGVGATPLREALSRLAARGLVNAIGKRGFRVQSISRQDLADIVRIRSVLEREAIRLSLLAGDGAWEGAIVGALHQLKRYIAENPKGFGEGEPAFDALHKRFHGSLLAACGSPRLIAACARLYDEAYRYRRLMMAAFTNPGEFVKSHEILAEAAIERATERAQALAEAHIASTLALVYPEAASPDA
ncbi:GntR family transcriptional regulator [Roseiarcus sp.]|uniref:GntR family transcriptional regulator n=1 Tax=Roseiarcus sp. TaxID=1969460 RepID=UPI003F9BF943